MAKETKANPGPRSADSLRADLHPDLKPDFVPVRKDLVTATRVTATAIPAKPSRRSVGETELHPLFNMSDWCRRGGMRQDMRCSSLSASNGERARVRSRIHSSTVNNANYAWIQHFIHHRSSLCVASVMANVSMSTQTSNEGEIHKALIEAHLVDCMPARSD